MSICFTNFGANISAPVSCSLIFSLWLQEGKISIN